MISNDAIKYRNRNGDVKEVYSEDNPPPLYNHYVTITANRTSAAINLQYCSARPTTVTTIRDFVKILGTGHKPANGYIEDTSGQFCLVMVVEVKNIDAGTLTAISIRIQGSIDFVTLTFDDSIATIEDKAIKII